MVSNRGRFMEHIDQLEGLTNGSFRRIPINSSGIAGTVAHTVFEEPPQEAQKAQRKCNWTFGGDESGEHIIVPLSANSKTVLEDQIKEWISFRSTMDALSIVSWLSTRQTHYDARIAVIANSGCSFRENLARYSSGECAEDKIITQSSQAKTQKVCFVFPGQGQQWDGMGKRLYFTEPVFRNAVNKCDELFTKISGTSLIHDIGLFVTSAANGLSDLIDETEVLQPAIFFLQVGLHDLWNHWGVQADAVVASSLGELAAAYACGGITIEEAVTVIYHRSTEQKKLKRIGNMLGLRTHLKEVEEICSEHQDIYVAGIHGPKAIIIAGQKEGIERISQVHPTISKTFRVQCAFHTPHMDAIKVSFERSMSGVVTTEKRLKQVPFYSGVTGKRYEKAFGTDYWWQSIRQPVCFQSAIECILNEVQPDVFLELGSSQVMLSPIRQIIRNTPTDRTISTIPSCLRNKDDRVSILQALGALYVAGKSIEWNNVSH